MKILLVAIALLVVIEIEAHPGWSTYPGFQNQRGNNPDHGWRYPQRIEQQNNKLITDIELVCQNPRTNDIVRTYTRIAIILKSSNINIFVKNQSFMYRKTFRIIIIIYVYTSNNFPRLKKFFRTNFSRPKIKERKNSRLNLFNSFR